MDIEPTTLASRRITCSSSSSPLSSARPSSSSAALPAMAAENVWLASFIVVVLVGGCHAEAAQDEVSFGENYEAVWGDNHVKPLYGGKEVQLQLDGSSGSAFHSKLLYTSGFFRMWIKLPGNDSAGVVTAFYLSSESSGNDELDFEFLGNRKGKPSRLQTNVFADGKGNREQRIGLWFDPAADFHEYTILWNTHQIVFFVDNVPIRVYGNQARAGVGYPRKPMRVIASLWNGESWATDGGKEKINWSQAPFTAAFRGFSVDGCPAGGGACSSPWWNNFSGLNSSQQRMLQQVKRKYTTYDYCTDSRRYPTPPPECPQ